jgi:hypothetical protein
VSGLSDSEDSNASKTEAEAERIFTGTIDVVTGRGRFLPEKITLADSAGSEPDLTAPRLIENERGFIETDKEPAVNGLAVSNRKGNPTEGDPDFINDMSRVYVSMSTDGDDMFGLTDNMPNFSPTKGGGGSSGGAVSGGGSAFTNTPIEPVKESPYVIVKSDEIRIIARYDEQHDINGSIKIVKEGYPDDTSGKGRASIIIQPDGSILIDGPRVVIASGGGDGGGGLEGGNDAGDTVAIGHNASESMVLGNTLSDFLTKFCQTAAPEVGNCGGPLVNLKKACLDLKDDIDSLKHLSTMAKLR